MNFQTEQTLARVTAGETIQYHPTRFTVEELDWLREQGCFVGLSAEGFNIVGPAFCGRVRSENGTQEEQEFGDYEDLCKWLARFPEYGIEAYKNGEPIEQGQLQNDTVRYCE